MEYMQFCPISKAAEVLGERWNILILREFLCGTSRFGDLQRALGTISPSLLTRRLKELTGAGLLARSEGGGQKVTYVLTSAGLALKPAIEAIGAWGMTHARGEMTDEEMDVDLLMWDIRRRIEGDQIPGRRATLCFHLTDQPRKSARWWIRIDGDERELCTEAPCEKVDVTIVADTRTLITVWMGDRPLQAARDEGALRVEGDPRLCARLRQWIGLNVFADPRYHGSVPALGAGVDFFTRY